jgi:hypothetical protein
MSAVAAGAALSSAGPCGPSLGQDWRNAAEAHGFGTPEIAVKPSIDSARMFVHASMHNQSKRVNLER